MPRFRCCLALFVLWHGTALAQRAPFDPPIADRPPGFSNIVGKYAIEVKAEPTEVHVEEPVTLRVIIKGRGPKAYEPKREHLQVFPEWADDFYVQEIREQDRLITDTWVFVYRLRPKHTKIDAIDGIKLVYYNPDRPGKKKYAIDFASSIPIRVTPKPDTAPHIEVPELAVPDSFYRCAEARDVLTPTRAPIAIARGHIIFFLTVVPVACLLGAWIWRRRFPDEGLRQERHRSRAAQRALEQLQAETDAAWNIIKLYLRERFDFPVDDPTPVDVAAFLKRRGFAKELCGQSAAFFQACDARRFTVGAPHETTQLAAAGAALIHALEADPCVH